MSSLSSHPESRRACTVGIACSPYHRAQPGDGDDYDDGDGDDYDGDGGQLLRRPMALVMAKFSLQLHPICHTCIHEADSGDNRI